MSWAALWYLAKAATTITGLAGEAEISVEVPEVEVSSETPEGTIEEDC